MSAVQDGTDDQWILLTVILIDLRLNDSPTKAELVAAAAYCSTCFLSEASFRLSDSLAAVRIVLLPRVLLKTH